MLRPLITDHQCDAPANDQVGVGPLAEQHSGRGHRCNSRAILGSRAPTGCRPTLQHLEDEGLITSEQRDGKKVFSLTEAGRATNPADRAPWEDVGVDGRLIELRDGIGQVAAAVRQIARSGTPAQVAAAKTILVETRRALYRILAGDDA